MVGQCNGYTVTGLRHSRYTESNIYLSCTRVERGFLYMLVTCSIGCTSHQSLILYIVAINIYNIMRSNRGTGDPLQAQRYTPHRAGVAYLILSCRGTPHIEQGWPTLSSSNGYTSHRVGVAHFLGFSIADNDYCCHTACHSTTSTFP